MSLSQDAEREAKLLIEKIRAQHSLEGHDELAVQFQDLLHLAASELYDVSTHFLFELLQNADDNDYQTPTPTLTFTYEAGGLRVDCNETGFRAKHVESISKIRCSTKSGQRHLNDNTGEKGIGFKSVFRVADQVWISSRQYRFKFVKNEHLGMIAPRWADFLGPTSPEQTSFYLKLSDDYNEEELVDELQKFDPIILVFLKRLQKVTMRILTKAEQPREKSIYKTTTYQDEYALTILNTGNDSQLQFLTIDYRVENLPSEPRRLLSFYSIIDLAFPLTDLLEEPEPTRYKVHAVLPIGDYGLKFLLNADFLLTANRLHIDISLPWNQTLRDGLTHAFIQAVNYFNKGKLRYHWPYYIPTSDVSDFFQPSRHSILQILRDNECVESAAGVLRRPTSLFYVHPTRYADENGNPLTLNTQTKNKYLSSSFPIWTICPLLNLGVRELTNELFLDDLESMFVTTLEEVHRKPPEWHVQLAKALLHMVNDPPSKNRLFALPIIPLRGGGWTTAKQCPVLFSRNLDAANFPINTTFQIVDPEASAENHRYRLFVSLGIQEVDTPRMCRYIADAHASWSFEPYKLSKEELVSHVEFLCQASWFPPKDAKIDLWFVTSDDERFKGSQLYIQEDFPKESPRANVLEKFKEMFSANGSTQNDRPRLRVIHQDYLSQSLTQDREDMEIFLIERLHLSKIPRLVSSPRYYSKQEYNISKEFKFLLQECPISDIIDLLCFHWKAYSPWVERNGMGQCKRSMHSLIQDIQNSVVQTLDGPSFLSKTFIPMLDARVNELEIPLPTLDIPNPKDKTLHRILAIFGVKVENDLDFYMACLRSIRKHHTSPEHEAISYVYEQIQVRHHSGRNRVIEEFDNDGLIYDTTSKSWLNGAECARKKIDLKCMYPKCKDLFLAVMDPYLVNYRDVVERAGSINLSSELSDILDILVKINEILKDTGFSMTQKLQDCIRSLAIFPTKKKLDSDGFDELLSCDDTWFIADRPHLARSFDGTIPLLAFHTQDVHAFEKLLQVFDLDSRRLSECITKTLEPSGNFMVSDRDTYFFRARSAAFKALITKSNPRRAEKCRQLDNVSVVWVTSIYRSCTLKYKSEPDRIGIEVSVEYALQSKQERDELTIFTTNTQGIYRAAPFELAELLVVYCDIHDLTAQTLLYTVISEPECDRVQNRFKAEGYHIHLSDTPRNKRDIKPRSGDLLMIPSTFSDVLPDDDFDNDLGLHTEKDAKSTNPDRRVPPMNIRNVYTKLPEDPINPIGVFLEGAHMDPGRHLEYLGQCMTSQFLKGLISGIYDPLDHWTSDLRIRAGLPSFVEKGVSPFTIKDKSASQDMTNFLVSIGHERLKWNEVSPAYHLEIAVSSGDVDSPFIWSSSQLRRMQIFQNPRTIQFGTFPLGNPENIMILVRVINIYTDPQIHFIVDPWVLLASHSLIIQDGLKFEATIQDVKTVFFAPGLEMHPFFESTRVQCEQEWTYTYKSLKDGELRLFILFPGKKYDRLKGAIFTCPSIEAAKTTPYRTLSYEWGSNQQSYMPLFTHEGIISLRTTLHTMLKHLRQETSPVILWVDAICINQEDVNEKTQQILLLPRIFQNAVCTLAFFSVEGHFDEAIKTLLQIRARDLYGSCSEKWPESLLPIPVSWAPHSSNEVTLAPTVRIVCGSWMVDWNEIYEAVVVLQRKVQLSSAIFNSWKPFMTISHMRGWEVRRSRWNMLKLLNTFSYADSTLKRDRFFSLLGLASDGNLEAFQPDYRADVTFESIACRFGNAFIDQGHGIQLLYQAGLSQQPDRFPSWLPDLTVPQTSNLLRYREQGAVYRASADKREEIYCFPPRLLAVKGYLVDEIDQISRSMNNRSIEARFEYLQEIDMMIGDMAKIYSSIDKGELIWQVPVAGVKQPKAAFSECIDIVESYKAFRQQLEREVSKQKKYHKQDEMADSIRDLAQQKKSIGYGSLLCDNLLGWRFVITRRNFFGVVPGNAQVGDLVSIINGGDVPFLLRKHETQMNPLRYNLIGGCYIHGIMLGEALSFEGVEETMIHID
ncbi:hypothetical protein F4806DRAFT_491069 [Annulohypoxylon nitens]|nr:hypothetical protein F4806DRAFT_491069 [Annulohypoxylon nitens]